MNFQLREDITSEMKLRYKRSHFLYFIKTSGKKRRGNERKYCMYLKCSDIKCFVGANILLP